MRDLKSLIGEIHRRSLWQVVGIYLVCSWVALQVVDVLKQNFGLPEWFPAFALGLLVLGLPIVVATAFVQEGLAPRSRDASAAVGGDAAGDMAAAGPSSPVAPRGSRPSGLFTWRNAVIGGGAALALWGIVAAGWLIVGGRDADASPGGGTPDGPAAAIAEAADLRSIAVLPFETRSEERQDEYFSEGMHDDLLTQLSKIDSLTVISRTSVMQYASTTKTIREIAAELDVATILEGAVQRAGDRVRVNVQLIEAASDRHLWAETYDEELTAANIFAIQSDLAREIAGALRATLTPDVAERMAGVPTESMEAYELYARARYVYETRGTSGQNLDEIQSLFERAIAADSSFAPAWAGLANVFLGAWNWRTMSPEEAGPRARMAVERALALDPTSADSYVAESRLLQFEGRDEEAERAIRQALELNPGSADAHARYGAVLERAGRYEEAVQQSRRAVELDPLSINGRSLLSDRLFYARRYDESIAESRKVLEMQPDDWYSWYNMGWAYSVSGRPAQAVEAFREARGLAMDRESVGLGLAYAFAKAGERDSTMAYLEGSDPSSYDASLALFELGDTDEAFASLETALEADPSQLRRLALDPSADGLRADPRYEALARRFGSN